MLYDNLLILLLHLDILAHDGIGTQPKRQSDNEADADLTNNLIFSFQALFVALEDLDIVIHESEEAQPEGGDNHQDDIDVTDTAEQDNRHEDADDDDDATHRRHTLLLHAKGVDTRVALCLENLPPLHPFDKSLTKPGRDQKG